MSFRLLSQQSFTIVLDQSRRVSKMIPLTNRNILLQHQDYSMVLFDIVQNQTKHQKSVPFLVDKHIMVDEQNILLVGQKNVALFNWRSFKYQHYPVDIYSSYSQFCFFPTSSILVEIVEMPKKNTSDIVAYSLTDTWTSEPLLLSFNKPFVVALDNHSLLMEIHEEMTGMYYRQINCQKELEILNRCKLSTSQSFRFLHVELRDMNLYIVGRNDQNNIDLITYSLVDGETIHRKLLISFSGYILNQVIGWTPNFLIVVKVTRDKDPKHFIQLYTLKGDCVFSLRDEHQKIVKYELDCSHSSIYAVEKNNQAYFEKVKGNLPTVLKLSCIRLVEKGSLYMHLVRKMRLRLTNTQISNIVSLLG